MKKNHMLRASPGTSREWGKTIIKVSHLLLVLAAVHLFQMEIRVVESDGVAARADPRLHMMRLARSEPSIDDRDRDLHWKVKKLIYSPN